MKKWKIVLPILIVTAAISVGVSVGIGVGADRYGKGDTPGNQQEIDGNDKDSDNESDSNTDTPGNETPDDDPGKDPDVETPDDKGDNSDTPGNETPDDDPGNDPDVETPDDKGDNNGDDSSVPEVEQITVHFVDGTSIISDEKIDKNSKVNKPADPTKENHNFEGWYADADFLSEFDFDKELDKDTYVYAKFTEIKADNNEDSELKSAKEAAKMQLADYRKDDINAFISDAVFVDFAKIKSDGAANIDAAADAETINAALNAAKAEIDRLLEEQKIISLKSVSIKCEDIAITEPIVLAIGSNCKLGYVLDPVDSNNVDTIKWSSNDADKVSVDENGLVTALASTESVIITLTVTDCDGKTFTASVQFTVIKKDEVKIELVSTAEVDKGASITLTPVIVGGDETEYTIKWDSDDENIATVKDGVVTGVGAGTARITATVIVDSSPVGIPAQCLVTVYAEREVTHRFDITAVSESPTSGGTFDGFVTDDSTELVKISDFLLCKNGGNITFTTYSDDVEFKIMFQTKRADCGINITGENGFNKSQMQSEANTEYVIKLEKAGIYSLTVIGREIRFYYMEFTDVEPVDVHAKDAAASAIFSDSRLEAILPANKNN